MDLAKKITFLVKKPLLVVVSSQNKELIFRVLDFMKEQGIKLCFLAFEPGQKLDSLASKSKKVIFIADGVDGKAKTYEFVRKLRENDVLISNFDDEETRELWSIHKGKSLSYGFLQTPDLTISDLAADEAETNFKIGFEGHIVPVWLQGLWTKKQVAAIAAAAICALEFGFNLVEVSQRLKNLSSK